MGAARRRLQLRPGTSVEVSAVKEWLEIEAGVGPFFGGGHTQWATDLLFKKPFALSDGVEFEFGVGPEWMHTTGGGQSVDSIGGEAVIEFMFWPWPERKFGWNQATDTISAKGMNNRLA
jgi:hypothetical protein